MSRRYAQLQTTIWTDPDFVALDADAQLLYLKLLSEPSLSHAGVCGLTERRWARSTADHDRGAVEDALKALEAARFVVVDEDTEEVLVRSFVRHGTMLSAPKRIDGVEKDVALITSDRLRLAVHRELGRAAEETISEGAPEATADRLRELLETIPETVAETIPETVCETVTDTGSTRSLTSPSPSTMSMEMPESPDGLSDEHAASQRSVSERSRPKRKPRKAAPPRARDELFEAIVEVCPGYQLESLTKTQRGRANAARSELADIGATPADVQRQARRFRAQYRDATLTPQALAGNWDHRLASQPAGQPRESWTAERERADAETEAEIEAMRAYAAERKAAGQ